MLIVAALGFHNVGYGCTTCIGNSGPLAPEIDQAIVEGNLIVGSVISGNRHFEGRVHNLVKGSYLGSPPLVVAYAIAGTIDINLTTDALGQDSDGNDVYLKDLWPTDAEIKQTIESSISPEMFRAQYADVFSANPQWNAMEQGRGFFMVGTVWRTWVD